MTGEHGAPADIVAALLSTLEPYMAGEEPCPAWARLPRDEAEFCASLLAHVPYATAITDECGCMVMFEGIRLKTPEERAAS